MTLLDSRPPKPRPKILKFLPLIIVLVLAASSFLAYRFWNISEERTVAQFLRTLEQGEFQKAYQLWKPSGSYTYGDFLRDWGEQGDYGKIRDFTILRSKSKGSTTVIVTVRINHVDPPLDLLVDRKTKGLAYSVF